MLSFENQNIEFKQAYVPDIRKEVMGFANAEGGTVYIGVRKDGAVVGVDDPDGVMLQVVNSLKDSLSPDVMPFVKVSTVEMEGKQVVEIDVTTGTNRPYYLREKGLKPSGVYVRKGSSTQPMTEEGIREMLLQNSGRSYESGRSMNQDLTFQTLLEEMLKRSIEIGTAQMKTLKLIGEDGLYTNLALLLSDQCETTTKIALFQGTDKELFREKLSLLDMGLEDRMKQPVGLLSGGQRQALTLLMATLVTPKLLLLDEHTAALDPATAEKVLELTKSIVAEKKITCLMVTHNMHQALELGNRTLMMDAGRIVFDVQGEERSRMTVDDLLEKFRENAGKTLDNDRILLSKVEQ